MPSPFPFGHDLDLSVDRRTYPRRKGKRIKVLISDYKALAKPVEGIVLDRSQGGLCLAVTEAISAGSRMSVRPANAPELVPWAHVEIVYCQPRSDGWALGCQFTHRLPWSVLVLFG